MSQTYARRLALALAVLFLTSAIVAQQAEKKAPAASYGCTPDTCVTKDVSLPNFAEPVELQDVVNMFRAVVGIRIIQFHQPEPRISLTATPEQLAIADKLVNVLETLRTSGGSKRSSILVYQFRGSESGTNEATRTLAQSPQLAAMDCGLTTCIIKILYLPDLSPTQLYDAASRIRSATQITQIDLSPWKHVIVIRGTSEQIALAERLASE